jgi:hypothetical protein
VHHASHAEWRLAFRVTESFRLAAQKMGRERGQ